MAIRILVVDDHEAVREGFTQMFNTGTTSVVSTSPGGDDVLFQLDANAIDVVVLDVRIEKPDGLALLEKMLTAHPELAVVMVSAYDNPTYIARAAAIGAKDYLLKSDDKEQLINAVIGAAQGTKLPETSRLRRMEQMMQRETNPAELPQQLPLTPREIQVMRHIGLGLSNKEIAKSLMISVETVKEHVQNILRKANANDRTDAAVRAVRMGLVE